MEWWNSFRYSRYYDQQVGLDTKGRTVQQWLQTSELKVQEKVKLSSVSVLSSLSCRSEIYLSIGIDTGGVTPPLHLLLILALLELVEPRIEIRG